MKNIWKWFDGKKTAISLIYAAILGYCQVKGYIDPDLLVLLSTLGGILFGIGAGHKIDKALKK
ncbi:MAG: hypothetical protein ACUZ8E_07280 [Candidatus Anammoxibacter sp.]